MMEKYEPLKFAIKLKENREIFLLVLLASKG
jgi:hypothetical protein